MPYASDFIDSKQVDTTAQSTADWDMVDAQIRERAFFMAGVSNARILQAFKDAARDVAAGKLTMNEARKRLRAALREAGYEPAEDERGGIHDLSSRRRMEVTLETNVALARGWMQRQQMLLDKSQPGLRLFRARRVRVPRNWVLRWGEAAARIGWQGVARGGEFVALIDSPIWREISRFGVPYPPFDFGSQMRVKAVPYEECERLGLFDEPGEDDAPADETAPEEAAPEQGEADAEPAPAPESPGGIIDPKEAESLRRWMEERARLAPPPMLYGEDKPRDVPGQQQHTPEQVKRALESLNENVSIPLHPFAPDIRQMLIELTRGVARVENGRLVMIDKNGSRPYSWDEIGKIITAKGSDGVPNLQEDIARQMINDSGQINKSAPNDPRRPVAETLRDRIIPTVSDGSNPKMTIHRALTFSNEEKFYRTLQSILAVDENNHSWYRPRNGFEVDSWNNNQATIYRYASKRYSIILHMKKYRSRRRIDGLYKYVKTDKQPPLGISSEGESWMPGDIPLRVVSRHPKITRTEDGRVIYEIWVEEP